MSQAVHDMFHSIAERYDLANQILSLGVHNSWRRNAIAMLKLPNNASIADICTGTGDVAFELNTYFKNSATIYGFDFVRKMVKLAAVKQQQKKQQTARAVHFSCADAMCLPVQAESFAAVTCAFGIRNVDDPLQCLREFHRVLKDSGQVLILEFGKPQLPVFSQVYDLYGKHLMPRIGGMLSGNRAAYEYLPQTAKAFPDGEKFVELMRQAGFHSIRVKSFMTGVAYAYCGQKSAHLDSKFEAGQS
ncbi:bifunctional demethylmenaquinone methyltransferase/2-methoxy-6-polyprenyl-1,4-benzoquinol methylase UbiE [bacterium]|nr:bifunctional demethylmenaquinone methyltransferase/2-methoxy-6-polyprenyl-1,4-benzoquinol methylase UbiE [bacterium]